MIDQVAGAAPAASEGNAAPAVSTPAQVTIAPTPAPPSMEDTMGAVFDKLNPARDETGQFKAAAEKVVAEAEAAPEKEAAPAQETNDQKPEPAKEEPLKTAIPEPVSWSAEMKAKWAALPPDVQEYVAKRDSETHKRITELGEAAKASEQLRTTFDRHRASLKGANPAEAAEKLLAANDYLERDAPSAIKWLADAYGVDLSSFARPADGNSEPQTEHIRSLEARVARAEKLAADANARLTTKEQREAEVQQVNIAKQVEDFAKDKPHWADIEADVFEQIHAVKAREPNLSPEQTLKKAYDRALKVNDTVAQKISEETRKAAEAKKATEDKRKADEAKRLASLNVKSTKGASPKASGSWEDTMREIGNRIIT